MPRVPYEPVPSVAPQATPTPNISLNAPGAAFGAGVAEALGGLGKQIEHSGAELFQRAQAMQDLRNRSEADDADAKYMEIAGKLHADYGTLQGRDAVDAFPKYMEDLKQARTQIAGGMSNPTSRQMFDSASKALMSRSIFNGAGHSATENKKWAIGAQGARVDAIKNRMAQTGDDGEEWNGLSRDLEQTVRGSAELRGMSPEQTDEVINKHLSEAMAYRLINLAKSDPLQARRMLELNRDKLDRGMLAKVEDKITSEITTTGGRQISAVVNAPKEDGSPNDKTEQEVINEARDLAKKSGLHAAEELGKVEERVMADFRKGRAIEKDQKNRNWNEANGILSGEANGGKIPVNVDEFRAAPQGEMIWDRMDKTDQRKLQLALLGNSRRGEHVDAIGSQRRREELKGMAQLKPDQFLEQNLFDDKQLTIADRNALIKVREKLTKDASGDPRVLHAMQILRPDLVAAGFYKDSTGLNMRFVGALQDAIEGYQQEFKKPADTKAIKEIGTRLIQDVSMPGRFWGENVTPLFDIDVYGAGAQKAKEDIKAQTGLMPTDEQVRRAVIRMQYKSLYGAKPKAAPNE